jgi:predicted PurR-regulated permease PerM
MNEQQQQTSVALDWRMKKAGFALMCMAIAAGALAFLRYLRPLVEMVLTVLSPFIVALIVAYVFNPLVVWLQRRFGFRRPAGVAIAYGLILFFTVTFFAVLVPVLYVQLRAGVTNTIVAVPKLVQKAGDWMDYKISEDDATRLREALEGKIDWNQVAKQAGPVVKFISERAVQGAGFLGSFVLGTVAVVLGFFAFVAFVVVITFYFLLDYAHIGRMVRIALPHQRAQSALDVWRKIDAALGGYLRGQLTVCVIVAVLYMAGLLLLGMRSYAVLIGFCAGFGNLVPYLGPLIGGIPTAMWIVLGPAYPTLQAKIIGVILVLVLGSAVQAIDGFLLQPRIVGKNAGLHPLLIILALFVGAQFGLGGLIIAVPSAIIVRVLIQELWWKKRVAEYGKQAPQLENSPPS